jgi:acetolactate decarboxylase
MKKAVVATLFACACSGAPRPPTVRVFGAVHAIMAEGKTEATVALADVVPGAHTWALGALSGLRGEILVLDDRPLASYPDGGKVRLDLEARGEQAALLVAARVEDWTRVPVAADIPAAELEAKIAELAAAAGVDPGKPFPFRVEGRLLGLSWHIHDAGQLPPDATHDDRMRAALRGSLASAEGSALGFYSTQHGGVFTHMGRRTHIHAWLPAEGIMGHCDEVGVAAGSVLLVPRR